MSPPLIPDLQSCILCEEVRQEINGNFILLGILGDITVPSLPITAFKLCLFSRWCCGVGEFHHHYRILLPDETSVIASTEGKFQLKSINEHLTQVTVFGNVQFQQPGTHWVEAHLDDELKLRFPMGVRVVPPPQPPK